MDLIWKPSPNYNLRPDNTPIDLAVLHGTVGSDKGDLFWTTNPTSKVSYHYLITRKGHIYYLVREMHRAWHAGKSSWQGREDCNDYSIGIAFSNWGPTGATIEQYTDAQYRAGGWLLADLWNRRDIFENKIVGHEDVSPGRKTDPWDHFDWNHLYGEIYDSLDRDPAPARIVYG